MRIVIGAPGNGATLKDELKAQLEADDRVTSVVDLSSRDITYPQVSFLAAHAVLDGTADRGIFPEMLPAPDPVAVVEEEALRITARKAKDTKTFGSPALLTGTGASAGRDRGNVRSWGA